MLDVGSNTVHLLLVDAYRRAHPWPAHSQTKQLNLAAEITEDGLLSEAGADALVCRLFAHIGASGARCRHRDIALREPQR